MTTLGDIKKAIASNSERPPAGINDLIICIYGDKKVGKSSFAACFENPIFLDCEDALRTVATPTGARPNQVSMKYWSVPDDASDEDKLASIMWWSKFMATPVQAEQFGYRTLVVDGLNSAYKRASDYILAKYNEPTLNSGVLGYGKGLDMVRIEIDKWFTDLRRLTYSGIGIVITAHETMTQFENNNVKYDKRVPLVSGDREEKGWTVIKPSVDMIIHAAKSRTDQGIVHTMRTKGNELIEAADPTPDGRLPELAALNFDVLKQLYDGTYGQQDVQVAEAEPAVVEPEPVPA